MSEDRVSNLRNQARCKATSKRTGLPCNQPAMRSKSVCRFHGGKSTGPKTKEGRERIREAHFIHGRYSKQSDEHRLALRRHQGVLKLVQATKESSERIIEQFKAMGPYLKAYHSIDSKEEFGLINLFLFGGLNQMLKKNKVLRSMVEELFEILYDEKGMRIFEALLHQVDTSMAIKLGLSDYQYGLLAPQERQEACFNQFCSKLMGVQVAMAHAQEQRAI